LTISIVSIVIITPLPNPTKKLPFYPLNKRLTIIILIITIFYFLHTIITLLTNNRL